MLVGQAPGEKEPRVGRPFAWTAGKTLFRWFEQAAGIDEEQFRARVYFAAVCRCFPGKKATGGDRVPTPAEVAECKPWLAREIQILRPALVLAVGRLAIGQFIRSDTLEKAVGRQFRVCFAEHDFDLIPLPHPSGASPWHRTTPGKELLWKALALTVAHPAFAETFRPAAAR